MDVPPCHTLFRLWRNTKVLSMTLNGSSDEAGRFASGLIFLKGGAPVNPAHK